MPQPELEAEIKNLVEAATGGKFPVVELIEFGPASEGTAGRFKSNDDEELGFLITDKGTKVFRLKQEKTVSP